MIYTTAISGKVTLMMELSFCWPGVGGPLTKIFAFFCVHTNHYDADYFHIALFPPVEHLNNEKQDSREM